jgi:lysophospholipase L1-like esterase
MSPRQTALKGRGGSGNQVLLKLAVLAGTVVVLLGAAELALRVAFARSLDFSMEMWKYAVTLKQQVRDPHLSFAHVPNRAAFLMGVPFAINSHGLRDREYSLEKPSGVYRIVMLGDSTTVGWGVPAEQTVAKVLEQRLNQNNGSSRKRFEVLNAGVGNYGTVQEYTHYLTYDRAFHPDLVILEFFINDPEPVPTERHSALLGQSYLLAYTVSRFDTLMRLIGARPYWKEYYAGLYQDDRPGMQAAKKALADLAAATRADGAKLLVTILPELHQINAGYPFTPQEQKIKDVLAENQVPVLDLIEGLRGHGPESALWITPEDDHPNGKANSLIAAQILPWILSQANLQATSQSDLR